MGLLNIALIGGAGYWLGKKVTENRQTYEQQPEGQRWCHGPRRHPYQPDYYNKTNARGPLEDTRSLPTEKRPFVPAEQPPLQPREPFTPPTEKRTFSPFDQVQPQVREVFTPPPEKQQSIQYEQPQRQSHEKPLQLYFVEPGQGAPHPGHYYGGPGSLDRM